MRRLAALLLVALVTSGCADITPTEDTPLGQKVRDELAREAPIEAATSSPLQPLAGRRFIFVGGFLNEGIPGYFTDALEVARQEIGAEAGTLDPPSSSSLSDDA